MDEIIKIRNLTYNSILNNINISIYKNKINYISGSNNCGKNTLIRILKREINLKNSVFYNDKDITDISLYEFTKTIASISDLDRVLNFTTTKQELLYRIDKLFLDTRESNKRYKEVINILKLDDVMQKNIEDLTDYQKLKLLLAIELIKKPKVIILGGVFTYITKNEQIDMISILKKLNDTTIIMINNNLDLAIYSDYLHLLHKGNLILSGSTMDVLKKDSIINKLGLDLPFMVDLSLKLKYYNLIDDIELNMDRLVNNLWK